MVDPSPGLHEREVELATIEAEWQAARSGIRAPRGRRGAGGDRQDRPAAGGPCGARSDDVRVLAARAGELERHFPFGLVHQLLDAVVYGAEPNERDALFSGAAHLAAELFEHGQAPGGATMPRSSPACTGCSGYWRTSRRGGRSW